ncbi:hypothetical protein [Micromonospora sp. DT31]|uniref:hypothetical protein n=1 Tax=Micromonospora sp. DT31 TaxID=3393434 RepID=UPI003CF4E2CC
MDGALLLPRRVRARHAGPAAALGGHPGRARLHPRIHHLRRELAAFAAHAALPFPLLSDADGRLAAALLLPTFRAAGTDRFKRTTLLLDPTGTARAVQFPVTDPAGSVSEMLHLILER